MNLRARITRLQRSAERYGLDQPPTCPECRHRRGQVCIHRSRRWPDGREIPLSVEMPTPCGRCGAVPEQINHLVEVIITSRQEAKNYELSILHSQAQSPGGALRC